MSQEISSYITTFETDTKKLKKKKRELKRDLEDMKQLRRNKIIWSSLSDEDKAKLQDAIKSAAQLTRNPSKKEDDSEAASAGSEGFPTS